MNGGRSVAASKSWSASFELVPERKRCRLSPSGPATANDGGADLVMAAGMWLPSPEAAQSRRSRAV